MLGSFGLIVAFAASVMQVGAAKDAAEKAADPRDTIICKRFVETGSLVKGSRICKTKGEWERARDEMRSSFGNSGACGSAGNGIPCK